MGMTFSDLALFNPLWGGSSASDFVFSNYIYFFVENPTVFLALF